MDFNDDDALFHRWYGSWSPLRPRDVASLMADAGIRWWIVGGWAVDAFVGQPTQHDDIDVAFFADDLQAALIHLLPNFCVWSNLSGTLRPLRAPDELPEGCRQLWVRRDGDSPWLIDLALHPPSGAMWRSPRDSFELPLTQAIFLGADSVSYLAPEVVLAMRAGRKRPRDEADFAAIVPLLETGRRDWLASTLGRIRPGHPWIDRLRYAGAG